MRASKIEAVMQQFFTSILNERRLETIDRFVARDFIYHTAPAEMGNDLEGFLREMMIFFTGFFDVRYVIREQVICGNTAVVRWNAEAAHPGGLIGAHGALIPTGRRIHWTGVTMARLCDERITDLWVYQDALCVAQQLSALPIALCEN
jgi:predicted ester cyclase